MHYVIDSRVEHDLYIFFRKYMQMTDSEISIVIQVSCDSDIDYIDFFLECAEKYSIDEINKMWSSVISLKRMIERRGI